MKIKFNFGKLAIYLGLSGLSFFINDKANAVITFNNGKYSLNVQEIQPQTETPDLVVVAGKPALLKKNKLVHWQDESFKLTFYPRNEIADMPAMLTFTKGEGSPVRINKNSGEIQILVEGRWKCLGHEGQSIIVGFKRCGTNLTFKQVGFKKPLTAQQIRDKLVRTGASKTSNEQILAHIKELVGVNKFLEVTRLKLSQKLAKQKATIQDKLASKGELHPDVVKRGNLKERYAWFELPQNISAEQRAILVYRLLYGNMSNQKVMIIAHGWNDSTANPDFQQLANIALNRDPNILPLLINWEEGSWNGQGGNDAINAAIGKHLRAAKTILPIARVLHKQAKSLGVEFSKSIGIGHSLGSLMVGALGSSDKFDLLVALDQPSSGYIPRNITLSEIIKNPPLYDIDGNTRKIQLPFMFKKSANYSYSLVGFRSFAGNQWLASAHQNFLIDFRGGLIEDKPGGEHFYVVKTFLQLVFDQKFVNGELDIFGNNFQVNLDTKQFSSAFLRENTHDGVIFASPNYFDGKNGKVPSIDFFAYKKDDKLKLIGMSNSEAIARQFDTPNLFYFDHSIFKMTPDITGMKIIGGEGKQANCGSKDNYQDVAASNKSDIIDMSKSNEAVLCASQGHAVRQSNKQQDIMIGSPSGKNTFVLGDSKLGYYDNGGDDDQVTIRNFKNGESKLIINKDVNLQSTSEGKNVIISTEATRTGGWWGAITWLIGDGSNKVAVIEFDSEAEAKGFDLNKSAKKI